MDIVYWSAKFHTKVDAKLNVGRIGIQSAGKYPVYLSLGSRNCSIVGLQEVLSLKTNFLCFSSQVPLTLGFLNVQPGLNESFSSKKQQPVNFLPCSNKMLLIKMVF